MRLSTILFAMLLATLFACPASEAIAKDACSGSKPIPGLKGKAEVAGSRDTAIAIARAVALAAFGAESLKMREPLAAFEATTSWSIVGKLPEQLTGGDLVVRLCKVDGKVFHLEVEK